ncbi:hypothetical protein RB595_010436 [Gaeumannomyces hyphopodioides]
MSAKIPPPGPAGTGSSSSSIVDRQQQQQQPQAPPPPPPPSTTVDAFFASPRAVYAAAALLRAGMLLYGLWQDAASPVKYTDIDYLVFTDAARFVADGASPYDRATYRYTPLLAWMLLPTTFGGAGPPPWRLLCFSSGKVLFAAADLAAGWLLVRILLSSGGGGGSMSPARARRFASVWLLNPMVAAISTRGSSEGLLGVLVAALLWAVLRRRVVLAGLILGFGVHFKIYPFIYAPAIVWWMDDEHMSSSSAASSSSSSSSSSPSRRRDGRTVVQRVASFITPPRLLLAAVSLSSFAALNLLMYAVYGHPFLAHTYLHHVTRIDHRHNFSPYNTLLYLKSASAASGSSGSGSGSIAGIESVAFVPQLLLSTVLVPLALAKRDLASAMLAQTFAFVAFNKVCTSQYFLWYMVLLPLYLPRSSLLAGSRRKGLAALLLWVVGQAAWLQQGFELEFVGRSVFLPGLWLASLAFFLINCWILGVVIFDVGAL